MTKPTEPDDPKQSSDSTSDGGGERPSEKAGFRPSPTPRLASAPLTPVGRSKPDVKADADAEPKADDEPKADADAEPKAKADAEPKAEAEPKADAAVAETDAAADEKSAAVSPSASDPASSSGESDLVESDLEETAEADAASEPAPESSPKAAESAEQTGGNGQSTALPPPWQRMSAAQSVASSASSSTRSRATAAPASAPLPPSVHGPRPEPAGSDVRGSDVRAEPRSRPRQPEPPAEERPREPRTVADEARAAGFDQPTTKLRSPYPQPAEPERPRPAPGGFPMSWPRGRQPRQANLQLKRLDPWSVLKIALVLAVVLYLIWLVAVGVLYGVLDGIGVWNRLNGQYTDLVAEQGGDRLITAGRVFGVAAVVGAVNSLLVAVSLSVGAFIYNVSSDLVGGLELTLSERD